MATRTVTLSFAQAMKPLNVNGDVPANYMLEFVNRLQKAAGGVPITGITISNVKDAVGRWDVVLTPDEEKKEMQAQLGALSDKVSAVRGLLPAEGDPMPADTVSKLRTLLG